MFDHPRNPDICMLSKAVQAWFQYYQADPDEAASHLLCNAALAFFRDGYHTIDDVTTMLIGTYVGIPSTWVNAPTSASVH